MARRFLGYAVTNSNGVATLSYTGTGVGKMNIIAESGGLASNTYVLEDCEFYNDSSEWYNASSRLTRTDNDDGSVTLTNTSASNGFYLANKLGTSKSSYVDVSEWELGTCIEFDIISTTDTESKVQLNDYISQPNIDSGKTLNVLGATSNAHVKVTVANDGAVQYLVNDTNIYNGTPQTSTFAVGFRVNAGKSLTFKDFKIYPI